MGFQQTNNVEYHPITPIGNEPLQFNINSGQTYLVLSSNYLVTRFKLTKKELGKQVNITNADCVSFIQGFCGTFIKNLRVSFNGKSVYNGNDLYAYNSYLRRRLGLGVSRNQGELEAAGYYEDGLDQLSGSGFEARRSLYENGASFESICTLDCDIFRQKKLLLNQVKVDIEITPHLLLCFIKHN
uniref:Uncharacterized protein n=1 Tax=Panagrolaimus superbus TaxID=310955 RepID=A0A914Y6I6_9BILA